MVVVSSREFRANQRKYFDLARTNDVVITSRSHGSYRLVPVMEDDTLIDRATLDAKIRQGIADYEAGKVYRMNEGESTEDFLGRMISENWYVHHLVFTEDAKKDLKELNKKAPQPVSKLSKLLDEVREHPRTGTGQVEQLKGYDGSVYSRRITKEHRLVYKIYDEVVEVLVLSTFGHYR